LFELFCLLDAKLRQFTVSPTGGEIKLVIRRRAVNEIGYIY